MSQELKNQYYQFLNTCDFKVLELVDSIFYKIDTLLLQNSSSYCKEELLSMIKEVQNVEVNLYLKMKADIESGVLQV